MAVPEKDWFTLSEVAERWECGQNEIIHYGSLSLLEICVVVPNNIYDYKVPPDCEYKNTISPGSEREGDPQIIALNVRDIKDIENKGKHTIYGGRYGTYEFLWYTIEEYCRNNVSAEPVQVDASNLRITKLARDKFEKEHNVGAFSEESPDIKPDSISETKERNYQKIIGALLSLLKGKRTQPYTNTLIIQELHDKYTNNNGFSKSSLDTKFAEAKKVIEDLG
jgi:hypothetical protein